MILRVNFALGQIKIGVSVELAKRRHKKSR